MDTGIDVRRQAWTSDSVGYIPSRLFRTVKFVELIDDSNGTRNAEDASRLWCCSILVNGFSHKTSYNDFRLTMLDQILCSGTKASWQN